MKKLIRASLISVPIFVVAFAVLYLLETNPPPESESSDWHAYLTEEELRHPLAKYWFTKAEVSPQILEALAGPPLDISDVLAWEDRADLLSADMKSAQTGWSSFEDGSGYVAVNTFFPGATAEMVDWWFEWAQREEDIRYKIWYPGAHYAMSQRPTEGAPAYENAQPYWGKSRFPVEDVGVGVAQLRLDFVAPSEFGFDELPAGSTMLAVRVGLPNGLLKTTDMIHYVRAVEGGVEMRSRFWIAREFEAMAGGVGFAAVLADNPILKRRLVPKNLARELALHCANEYSQLASFLPELFEQYGPESSAAAGVTITEIEGN